MAITYGLLILPKNIVIGNDGETAGGAKLFTYSSLNKQVTKPVYQDPNGTIPYTNPILFDLNGTKGPFYGSLNSTDPKDLYYLECKDSDDNTLWTIDNWSPTGGSGGGGGTTVINSNNLIANNVFLDYNLGPLATGVSARPLNTTDYYVSPGNHSGFTPITPNLVRGQGATAGSNAVVVSDTWFVKDNMAADDQITMGIFAPGNDPLTGDVTPLNYFQYQCFTGASENYKAIQFPLQAHVNSIDHQTITFTFWAKCIGANVPIIPKIRQFYGSEGSPHDDVFTSSSSITLTTTWTQYNSTIPIPTTSGNNIGTCGNDATFFWISLPLNTICNIQITKPCIFLGSNFPTQTFQTDDQIRSIIYSRRTGEFQQSWNITQLTATGWLPMTNDSTIGSLTSGASNICGKGTQAYPIYKVWWDNIANADAPVHPGPRGNSAEEDFAKNNQSMTVPLSQGRVMGNTGTGTGLTARTDGETTGSEITQLLAHTHASTTGTGIIEAAVSTGAGTINNSPTGSKDLTSSATTASSGSATPNNLQPTVFINGYTKL